MTCRFHPRKICPQMIGRATSRYLVVEKLTGSSRGVTYKANVTSHRFRCPEVSAQ
jgi:hypothetical protein